MRSQEKRRWIIGLLSAQATFPIGFIYAMPIHSHSVHEISVSLYQTISSFMRFSSGANCCNGCFIFKLFLCVVFWEVAGQVQRSQEFSLQVCAAVVLQFSIFAQKAIRSFLKLAEIGPPGLRPEGPPPARSGSPLWKNRTPHLVTQWLYNLWVGDFATVKRRMLRLGKFQDTHILGMCKNGKRLSLFSQ